MRDAQHAGAANLRLSRELGLERGVYVAAGRRSRFPSLRESYSGALGTDLITVDLDVTALVLEGLRRLDAGGWVRLRHPDGHLVLELGPTSAAGLLRPFEKHVLGLVDGQRSVIEICHESEVGDNQTLKLLYAFLATGIVEGRGRKVRALDQDFVPADTTYAVLESFNQMYRFIFAYMVKEVGPIAENVLAKYLGTVREARGEVLGEARLRPDGAVEEAPVGLSLLDARSSEYSVVQTNPAFTRITGYGPEEIRGRNLRILTGPDTS